MSILGDAIRNNADLHQAIFRVIGDLAAAHMAKQDISRGHLGYLCILATAILPHLLPPPDQEAEVSDTP